MTLSWRGLDQRAYYRVDGRGRDIDVTGCGNTLDLTHPVVARMVLDSLRYWVQECHVDGFRFDLAVALGRGKDDGYDRDHPFLVALRTDPVLSRAKLVAEPWDLGIHGWRTGQFPPPFSEWNDRYRDATRTFWLRDLAASASGRASATASASWRPASRGRRTSSTPTTAAPSPRSTSSPPTTASRSPTSRPTTPSTTAPTATAAPTGPTTTARGTTAWRAAPTTPTSSRPDAARCATCSARSCCRPGVPMLNAGDEFGRSQRGNNNPYSQDNEISWMSWDLEPWQEDLLETTRHLVRLRQEHPVLRQRAFFSGRQVHADGSTDLAWFAADGHPMGERWDGPAAHVAPGPLRRAAARSAVGARRRQRGGPRGRGHAAQGAGRDGIRAALGQRRRPPRSPGRSRRRGDPSRCWPRRCASGARPRC